MPYWSSPQGISRADITFRASPAMMRVPNAFQLAAVGGSSFPITCASRFGAD
jgi:hypothetical protein